MKSYVINFTTILLLIFLSQTGLAQDCPLSEASGTLTGNSIMAKIPINGNLFWTQNSNTQFEIATPNSSPPLFSTIFTTGIWLAGKNSNNELRLAAATYNDPISKDYSSGPIQNTNGQISPQCENFDRVWEVLGYEIFSHRSDFADNGIIDQPIPNIFAYPAHQNPHFESIHGFELPNTPQGLAPFFDQNNDGIYNPIDGDYPLPENVSANQIPRHMIWGVFNDAGFHTETHGEPLNVEIQLTAYSFYCLDDDDLLNNTIFTSHKIINRGNETLDSMIFTKFVDFDLGCTNDDFLGSIPEMNTFYGYNAGPYDGHPTSGCNGGMNSYYSNPPVQTVTILNHEMSSFIYFDSFEPHIGNPPPGTLETFYNYMNGRWDNGSPLTYGGNGYPSATQNQPTSFAFPHHPKNTSGWSMLTGSFFSSFYKAVANFKLGNQFQPNDELKIDIAYTFYQDSLLSNLETIDLVYDRTPILQQLYDNQFEDCNMTICNSDCVWTGDANRDSVVSNYDYLNIAIAQGATGTERYKPLVFQPFASDDWNQDITNIDLKHTDCNGDGVINEDDFAWVGLHLGNSYKTTPFDQYPSGNELSIVSSSVYPIDQFPYGTTGRATIELNQAESIFGLAFTLEYDTTYLTIPFDFHFSLWDENQFPDQRMFHKKNNEQGIIDYAFVKMDGTNSPTKIDKVADLRFFAKPQNYELVQTPVRLKNIRAILSNGIILPYGAQNILVNINNPDGEGIILSDRNLQTPNISIFPNPTSDLLNIKLEKIASSQLAVFDALGNLVLEKNNLSGKEFQLSTVDFSEGIYFLKIRMNGKEVIKKFIKI